MGSDACANCQRCSRSAATKGVTAMGRGSLHLATGGLSLVASGMRRKCGVCGHQRAEHRAELVANVGVNHAPQPQIIVQAPAPAYAAPQPAASQPDVVSALKDLAALRDQGVLTEDEFQAQKARVLAGG